MAKRVKTTNCKNPECGVLLTDDNRAWIVRKNGRRDPRGLCASCYRVYQKEYIRRRFAEDAGYRASRTIQERFYTLRNAYERLRVKEKLEAIKW